ncbi:MAG: CorA family divalent cation transporter [Allosphingosinicella sp.]
MDLALLVGDGPVQELPLEPAAAYDGPGFVWLHLEGRDETDLAFLYRQKDIPEVAAHALVATETRPRCDRIGAGAIVNLRGPGEVDPEDSDRLVSIRFWVLGSKVFSLSRRRLRATAEVVELMKARAIHDPGDLIAAFARLISKQLDPEVSALGDLLDDCETDLKPENAFRLRVRIAGIRADAIGYRRFVAPDRDALATLANLELPWLAQDDRLHIREAADRFARMAEEIESVRERAALLHEQLTDIRGEMLETRALLVAIVALIFLPLTFITGLFGMNVKGIPLAEVHYSFWYITLFCIALAVLSAAYFWWKGWIR